ncbi:MAG: phenylalanine--tRNA ligase subunit beta [Bacteroidota bacterium]|nr:phenylalanine--tRNA ligase subunit beta [Bacteroidota bacterium]
MKISLNWLQEYVDISMSTAELEEQLTLSGLEVEDVTSIGPSVDGVVVGHVLDVQPHPNADRLTVCRVEVGSDAPAQIVCGAPNVRAGQHVPVALPGCSLSINGKSVKIKTAKLRGVKSAGMICAEDELGLSDDHSGIMVLEGRAVPGEPLADYLRRVGSGVGDMTFDVVITPNRPDAACHIGVARDIAAVTRTALHLPTCPLPEDSEAIRIQLSVSIECTQLCRRYAAMLVRGVRVGESPQWLQQRLIAVGLRPINNIVDITNFVMYECGQPLHAFDYDRIAGGEIMVRASKGGEQFATLDGKQHTLPADTVLICDRQQPVALGGIMGGANSEVDKSTTTVLIESAWFDPSATRRTARRLGIQTDASYRFERGVDASGQVRAAVRAALLMAELSGGQIVEGCIDVHPNPLVLPAVTLRLSRIPVILGITIPAEEVVRILNALGFGVRRAGDSLRCQVPPHRPDVSLEVDLIEEVARIYGLDQIGEPHPSAVPGSVPLERPIDTRRESVHVLLNGRGYREIYTNSLVEKDVAEQFSDPSLGTGYPVVETLNPVSTSMTTLRPTLLPGLLKVMQFNTHHGQSPLRFYEFGHVFHRTAEQAVYIDGYAEYETLIMGISGPIRPKAWDDKDRDADFFDLKGDIEHLLAAFGLSDVRVQYHNQSEAITACQMTLFYHKHRLGCIAQLHPDLQRQWDLRSPAYFAEFNWTRLVLHAEENSRRKFTPVNRHPAADRDIAVVLPSSQSAGPLLETIRNVGAPLLQDVRVFDLYEDPRLGSRKKSLAFALRFGARRTLRDREIDRKVGQVVKALHELYGAELRS